MASPVLPAKVALFDLLETLLAGHVRWGQPTENEDYSQVGELLWLAEATSEGEFIHLGQPKLTHEFVLRIVVDVRRYGDNERDVEARAFALRDSIVAALVADRTIGGALNDITGIAEPVAGNAPSGPQQWVGQRVIDVACRAYETFT